MSFIQQFIASQAANADLIMDCVPLATDPDNLTCSLVGVSLTPSPTATVTVTATAPVAANPGSGQTTGPVVPTLPIPTPPSTVSAVPIPNQPTITPVPIPRPTVTPVPIPQPTVTVTVPKPTVTLPRPTIPLSLPPIIVPTPRPTIIVPTPKPPTNNNAAVATLNVQKLLAIMPLVLMAFAGLSAAALLSYPPLPHQTPGGHRLPAHPLSSSPFQATRPLSSRGGARTLNPWLQRAHPPPAAFVSSWPTTSRSNSGAPSSHRGDDFSSDQHQENDLLFSHSYNHLQDLPSFVANQRQATSVSPELLFVGDFNLDFESVVTGGEDVPELFAGLDVPGLPIMGETSPVGMSEESLSHDPQAQSQLLDLTTTTTYQHPLVSHATTTASTTTTTATQDPSSLFSCFPSNPASSASPTSTTSSSHKRALPQDAESAETVALKRQRNTLAARKYRQKRLDRIADLEAALAAMTGERDDLRLKLARREAEVDALREMLNKK